MISSICGPPAGVPAVKLACSYERGLLLGHFDGSFSVVLDGAVIAQTQNPSLDIAYMRVLEQTAYISFTNGLLAQYSLPTGILQQSVNLGGAIMGLFVQQDCFVVWGVRSQVSFINRLTLDVEKTLYFDSKPVRVHRDQCLAVVLRSGFLHFIEGRTPSSPLVFPINTGTTVDLIDALCIDKGKWVCIQRDKWSIVEQDNMGFTVELSSPGPGFFRKLIPLHNASSFAALCNEGQLLIVESNNIQILQPQWPTYALQSLIWDHDLVAILKDGTVYNALHSPNGWEWSQPELQMDHSSKQWIICQEFASMGCEFGKLDQKAKFSSLYTADDTITAICVSDHLVYLGHSNGSVTVLQDLEFVKNIKALATAIQQVKVESGCVLCWSTYTVGVVNQQAPTVIPLEDEIQNVELVNGHILCVQAESRVLAWNLLTLETCTAPANLDFDALSSLRVNSPFTDKANFEDASRLGFVCTDENQLESISLFDPKLGRFAATKFAILCDNGLALHAADKQLRNMDICAEEFEKIALLVDHRSDKLRSIAIRLMQSLTDKNRMDSLLQASGLRSSLLLSSLYPNVPVESQLKQRTVDLLTGSTTQRLIGLKILSNHPDLLQFPFDALRELQISSAARRFIKRASQVDLPLVSKSICTEIEIGNPKNFVQCVEFVNWVIEVPEFDLNSRAVFALVDSVARSIHRMPSGLAAVRKMIQTVMSRFSGSAVFYKQRQLLFIRSSATPNVYGAVWDLGNGNRLSLANPPSPTHLPGFTDDGKALVSANYEWRFPGTIATLFGGDTIVRPKTV